MSTKAFHQSALPLSIEFIMKTYAITAALLTSLLGCVTSANFSPTKIPSSQLEGNLDKVRFQLRDPDSAQFRNVKTYQSDTQAGGGIIICGLANARNAFGGLTGFKPFRASFTPQGRIDSLFIHGEGDYGSIGAIAAPCNGASG